MVRSQHQTSTVISRHINRMLFIFQLKITHLNESQILATIVLCYCRYLFLRTTAKNRLSVIMSLNTITTSHMCVIGYSDHRCICHTHWIERIHIQGKRSNIHVHVYDTSSYCPRPWPFQVVSSGAFRYITVSITAWINGIITNWIITN
jgi:hypothetical protein